MLRAIEGLVGRLSKVPPPKKFFKKGDIMKDSLKFLLLIGCFILTAAVEGGAIQVTIPLLIVTFFSCCFIGHWIIKGMAKERS